LAPWCSGALVNHGFVLREVPQSDRLHTQKPVRRIEAREINRESWLDRVPASGTQARHGEAMNNQIAQKLTGRSGRSFEPVLTKSKRFFSLLQRLTIEVG
jgi:hypothetical protein